MGRDSLLLPDAWTEWPRLAPFPSTTNHLLAFHHFELEIYLLGITVFISICSPLLWSPQIHTYRCEETSHIVWITLRTSLNNPSSPLCLVTYTQAKTSQLVNSVLPLRTRQETPYSEQSYDWSFREVINRQSLQNRQPIIAIIGIAIGKYLHEFIESGDKGKTTEISCRW